MDIIILLVLALSAAAAFVVWKQLQGQKPDPAEIFAEGVVKRKPRNKKPEQKKAEVFKWDAPPEKEEGSPSSADKKKSKKRYDPIAAGQQMVQAAENAQKAEEKTKEPTERQKNKLQAQGFVTPASKPKGVKRDSSPSHDDVADDDDDQYSGMSADLAERMKLLERIAAGKRATPDDFGDKDQKKKSTLGQERRIDHQIVADRLADEKKKRQEAMDAKTKIGGGRIQFLGSGVGSMVKNTKGWARAGSPSADADGDAAPEPAPAPAADEPAEAEAAEGAAYDDADA